MLRAPLAALCFASTSQQGGLQNENTKKTTPSTKLTHVNNRKHDGVVENNCFDWKSIACACFVYLFDAWLVCRRGATAGRRSRYSSRRRRRCRSCWCRARRGSAAATSVSGGGRRGAACRGRRRHGGRQLLRALWPRSVLRGAGGFHPYYDRYFGSFLGGGTGKGVEPLRVRLAALVPESSG